MSGQQDKPHAKIKRVKVTAFPGGEPVVYEIVDKKYISVQDEPSRIKVKYIDPDNTWHTLIVSGTPYVCEFSTAAQT